MSASNQTPTKNLPQFADDDKPTFGGDINGAFLKIDTAFSDQIAANVAIQNRLTSIEARLAALESA